jgi:hypothetical protein
VYTLYLAIHPQVDSQRMHTIANVYQERIYIEFLVHTKTDLGPTRPYVVWVVSMTFVRPLKDDTSLAFTLEARFTDYMRTSLLFADTMDIPQRTYFES